MVLKRVLQLLVLACLASALRAGGQYHFTFIYSEYQCNARSCAVSEQAHYQLLT